MIRPQPAGKHVNCPGLRSARQPPLTDPTQSKRCSMRVLMTGHNGYIGSIMGRMLREAGHSVTGLDAYYFERCTFGAEVPSGESVRKDIRDVGYEDVEGFDAVIHLAALCNDPLGNLN